MAKRSQRQKILNRIDCEEAKNELTLRHKHPPNSEKTIRQWSLNHELNWGLKNRSEVKTNLRKFWDSKALWPLDEIWIVDYLRHQWTNYEDVKTGYPKCYLQIHEHCLIILEKKYSCFKNECVKQRKLKMKKIKLNRNKARKIREKKRFRCWYKLPKSIEINIICRIVLNYHCCTMDDIISNAKNIYNQKISDKHIKYSREKKWIEYDFNKKCFKITKKYPLLC